MQVAYVADATPNGFYRAVWPMTALARLCDHRVRALALESERWSSALVRDIDVLFVYRRCDQAVQRLMRDAKAAGAAVVWDEDDDFAKAPKSLGLHKQLGGVTGERRLMELGRVLALADLVTTPSPHLAERFLSLGARRVTAIENYLPDDFLQPGRSCQNDLNIGWVAALEHKTDVGRCSGEGVRDVADATSRTKGA